MSTMHSLIEILRTPGAKIDIEDAAPTQVVDFNTQRDNSWWMSRFERPSGEETKLFVEKQKARTLDRWLDIVVAASGSEIVFMLIMFGLLTWALSGIKYGKTQQWAVIISDVQAILCYLFDSLLMRQLLNAHHRHMKFSATLQSRAISLKRMLRKIKANGHYKNITVSELGGMHHDQFSADLPLESWLGRLSTHVSNALGHLITWCVFWGGILVWLAFGNYMGWSTEWQLYINSATSALMVFIFAFLAHIQQAHSRYSRYCLERIYGADSALEIQLRTMTHDREPNESVTIPCQKVSKIQRAIFYYADLVGTLVGIMILLVVIVAWVVVGPALSFSRAGG